MRNKFIPWILLFLLFIATGLSFLDRQVLSMTIIKIQAEFNISDVEYGWVNTWFLISYAVMFTVGGLLMDRIGSKLGLAFAVAIWSLANCLHGLMTGFYQLVIFRFLLGVGEGGCFPGSAKTVYVWFDEKRRALANGIAIGGSAIGAVIAPPLTTFISGEYGWRSSFVFPGLIGIVWVIGWISIPWGNRSNTDLNQRAHASRIPFLVILKNKEAFIFILIRFLLDPVLYFIMFWGPKYLNAQRHIPFERIGSLFWIPFLGMGLSNIMGGWLSDQLIKSGLSVNRARKIVMGVAAALTLSAPFITSVSSVEMAVALMTLIMFAHGFWITNYITSISDIFGANGTSTVVGLSGTAGAVSALIINPMIGKIVQNYSYNPIWIISGIMYPIAFLLLLVFVPRIRQLHLEAG